MNPILRAITYIVLVISGLLSMAEVRGQHNSLPFEFVHIEESRGLAQVIVNSIFQDRDGYLWVGTGYGLYRFDGDHFVHFKHNYRNAGSIVNNIVHDICQDRDGNIWVATENGVSCFNPVTQRFRNIKPLKGPFLRSCYNIVCDQNNTIWFTSKGNGLIRYQPDNNQFSVFLPSATAKGALTSGITKNSLTVDTIRHGLWMSTFEGINFFDFKTGRFVNYRNNPEQLPIFTDHYCSGLSFDNQGHIVVADNVIERVIIYHPNQKKIIREIAVQGDTKRPTFPLAAMFVDQQHNLWCSSWNHRLFFVDANSHNTTELLYDPARKTSITATFFWGAWQHPDGSVWLGNSNGISITNPQRAFYQIYDMARFIPTINDYFGITSVAEGDSCWWACTPNDLIRFNPVTNRAEIFRLPLQVDIDYAYNKPQIVVVPNSQRVFIRFGQNILFRFDYETRSFSPFLVQPKPALIEAGFSHIMIRGDYLWVFGAFQAALRYQLSTQQWEEFPFLDYSKSPGFFVRWSDIDHNGTLWVDTYPKGLFRFVEREKRFVRQLPKLIPLPELEENFVAFCIDKKNRIWYPGNGILQYTPDTGKFRLWSDQDGLTMNHSGAVASDSRGQIWSVYYNRFSVFSPEKKQFRNFKLSLYELDTEYYTYMITLRNGHILCSAKGYLVEFFPEQTDNDLHDAKVLINSVAPSDTTYLVCSNQAPLRLGVVENNFSINYSVLAPTQNDHKYLYKLEGYDEKWVEAGTKTTANYTKIPGGSYTFRVKAVLGDSETPESTLLLNVDTEFYNSAWFRLLILLIIAGLTGVFLQYRTQQTSQMHHLQMQATRLERDKTDIQYQNLINHLNPHFLFNSLTSLNSLIVTEPKQASRFLQKLSAIYRYILQNKEKESVSLEHELNFVRHYIDLQKSRFEEGLQIVLTIPNEYLSREIVPVTLQNLFENAIKHNTIEDEKPLRISVYVDNDYLCVENSLQKKHFVETSNKQGLDSLKTLYSYLSDRPIVIIEDQEFFTVQVPLL